MPFDIHKDLLTTGDVSRQLGITRQWVRMLIRTGQLRAFRTPLGFLVSPESVADYQTQKESTRRYRVAYR